MVKLLIIADDLTGAMDTGVQFSAQGVSTLVTRYDQAQTIDLSKYDILVVNTESRHILSENAYKRVSELVDFAKDNSIEFIYKKTDSALRGNIGAELSAVSQKCNSPILFLPAYIETQRTTVGGSQFFKNKPLEKTEFGQDIVNPIKNSFIPDIVAQQSNEQCVLVGKGKAVPPLNQTAIYVFDAECEQDLADRAQQFKGCSVKCFAGCAGFAKYLPDLIAFKRRNKKDVEIKKNILLISASANSVSLNMLSTLRKCGKSVIKMSQQQLLDATDKDYSMLARQAAERLGEDGFCALAAVVDEHDIDALSEYARQHDISFQKRCSMIVQSLSQVARQTLDGMKDVTVIVFGGDTLSAFTKSMDIKGYHPIKEIEAGVVMSEIVRDDAQFNIITKAGAFGGNAIVDKIMQIRG